MKKQGCLEKDSMYEVSVKAIRLYYIFFWHTPLIYYTYLFKISVDFENWYKRKRKIFFITRVFKQNIVLLHKRTKNEVLIKKKERLYYRVQFTFRWLFGVTLSIIYCIIHLILSIYIHVYFENMKIQYRLCMIKSIHISDRIDCEHFSY